MVTAWSTLDRRTLSQLVSPDLMPRGNASHIRMRLRFYDVRFTSETAKAFEMSAGRFREAVVAFAGSVGEQDGEFSAFMWTDDDTYLAWGRENFGWPLERAEFEFEGGLWSGSDIRSMSPADLHGTARARTRTGTLGLGLEGLRPVSLSSASTAVWITPRRILRRAGLDPEIREVLLVRPEILEPGQKYEARGKPWLEFQPGHPLYQLSFEASTFEVIDGFRIRVGADVGVVASA